MLFVGEKGGRRAGRTPASVKRSCGGGGEGGMVGAPIHTFRLSPPAAAAGCRDPANSRAAVAGSSAAYVGVVDRRSFIHSVIQSFAHSLGEQFTDDKCVHSVTWTSTLA